MVFPLPFEYEIAHIVLYSYEVSDKSLCILNRGDGQFIPEKAAILAVITKDNSTGISFFKRLPDCTYLFPICTGTL